MQERRYDGSEKLTPSADMEQLLKAIEDPDNASVTMHKPGAEFIGNGHRWKVLPDGKLKKLSIGQRRRNRMKRALRRGRR